MIDQRIPFLAFMAAVAACIMLTGPRAGATEQPVSPPASITGVDKDRESLSVFETPTYLNINPGLISYALLNGDQTTRLLTSVLFDFNFSAGNQIETPLQYGLETGVEFSHVGGAGAGFFGTGGSEVSGANLFILPLDLWAGYDINHRGLLSIHAGANGFFRTTASSMALGKSDTTNDGSVDFFPAVGFRIGWTVARNFSLSFRSDWSLAPNQAVYAGMIGATIPIA